jgi:ribonuclease J
VIPGNETAIHALHNELVRQGVNVISDSDEDIHVSGHPARDELAQMYQWVRPKVSIPVHGEIRHLVEHARLARDCQVPQAIVGNNGSLIRLAPGKPEIIDQVESGRLALDGSRILPVDSPVLRARKRMVYNGVATVALVLDARGVLLAPPRLSLQGVLDLDDEAEAEIAEDARDAVERALDRLPARALDDDQRVREIVTAALRKVINGAIGKKPVTQVEVIRLD